MNWYVLLQYRNGTDERFYCTTRAEAREFARTHRAWESVRWATVRRSINNVHPIGARYV